MACTILHFQPGSGSGVPAASSTAALSSGFSCSVLSTCLTFARRFFLEQRRQRHTERSMRMNMPPPMWWGGGMSLTSKSSSSLSSRKMASVCAMASWHPAESSSRAVRRHMSASREPKPSGPPHLCGRPSPSPSSPWSKWPPWPAPMPWPSPWWSWSWWWPSMPWCSRWRRWWRWWGGPWPPWPWPCLPPRRRKPPGPCGGGGAWPPGPPGPRGPGPSIGRWSLERSRSSSKKLEIEKKKPPCGGSIII
mmetsp:Transcript_40772/g.93820  ORF Transcript_40772/g.93820 Transcript_40772/m.93820 type:complete len:249 (-) Transcript_40772:698-1444(-)